MRYLRILLLYSQGAFAERSMAIVWFLCAFVDVGILLFFWSGASAGRVINGWTSQELITYYLFSIITSQLLINHIEINISRHDIKEGQLVSYILKPFPYWLFCFFQEIPWRIMTGVLGVITVIILTIVLRLHITINNSLMSWTFAIPILGGGYIISFVYKMAIGLLAFWFTEIRGLFEALEVVSVILLGLLMPLSLLPVWLTNTAYTSPFAYIIYFPILALEGKLSILQMLEVIGMQIIWIALLSIVVRKLWTAGLKKFSAVGQ